VRVLGIFRRAICGPPIRKMSEPSRGTTVLRVIPAAFYLIIPLLCGPLMRALQLITDSLWPPPGILRQVLSMRRRKPGEIYFLTFDCSPEENSHGTKGQQS
jgi:hypothetical protein